MGGGVSARSDVGRLVEEAKTLAREGRRDEAVARCRRVLEIAPRHVEALCGLGHILMGRREFDAAGECFRRAIEADGGRGDAHAMEAVCHERMNRMEPALAAIERAVALTPRDANARLVRARLLRRAGRAAEARPALERLVAEPGVPPFLRRVIRHELATVLDRLGAWDAAFETFAESGRERWEALGPGLDPDQPLRRVANYRAGLRPERLAAWGRERYDDEPGAPAFLVGFPRSGTTMTEQVLAAHPRVTTSDEKPLLGAVWEALTVRTGGDAQDIPAMLDRVDRPALEALRARYWREVETQVGAPPAGVRFVDKLPLNLMHVGLVNAVFPDARVIVALRDPRDVCVSCFMQWFGLNAAMANFLSIARTADFYAAVMDLWLHVRDDVTFPYREIRYEDTVQDLETQARGILDLIGVEWDDAVLEFHVKARDRAISTPSLAAVTEPVHTRAMGRWKSYRRHLEPVLPRLERFVESFGYA